MQLFDQYKGLPKEIYIMFIGRIATRFGSMVTSMMTLILSQKLFMSATEISLIVTCQTILSVVFSIVGGKLADKHDKKKIIIIFDLISITLFFICGFIKVSLLSIALMVFAACFQWGERPAYDSLVADLTKTADRERAYALNYLGTNIGLLIAPTLGGLLFKNHLNLLYIICAISIGISTFLIAFKLGKITPVVEPEMTMQARRDKDSLWKVLMDNKVILLFCIATAFYSAAYNQYSFLIPLELGTMYGDNGAVIYGTISSANCLVVILCSPIILSVFKKTRDIVKVLYSNFLLLAGLGLFLIFIKYIPAYYIAITMFTLGEIFCTLGSSPYMTKITPASHRGRLGGLKSTTHRAMTSVMTILTGWLYDKSGSMPAWIATFVALGVAILATMICVIEDKKDKI